MIARAEGNARAAIGERYVVGGPAVRAMLRRRSVRQPSARQWWRPDAELLAIAHAIRREIEAAEGFRRPPV